MQVLLHSNQFRGYCGDPSRPEMLVLRNHGLHVLIKFDPGRPIGRDDRASVSDVILEAALTAIMDCEDSVASVDGADKIRAYRNWLGLMTGQLSEEVHKNGNTFTWQLADDITFSTANGAPASLRWRALMFVRNVGHLTTTSAVLDQGGKEIRESILDAYFTVVAALHDRSNNSSNSPAGSIYVVKPKMHGPEEVSFADALFCAVDSQGLHSRSTTSCGLHQHWLS